MRASRYLLLNTIEDTLYALSCERATAQDSDLHRLYSALVALGKYVQEHMGIRMLPKKHADTSFYSQLDTLLLRAFPVLLGLEQAAISTLTKQVDVENLITLLDDVRNAAYSTCGAKSPRLQEAVIGAGAFSQQLGATESTKVLAALIDDWVSDNNKPLSGVLAGANVSPEVFEAARAGSASPEAARALNSVLSYLTSDGVSWFTASDVELRVATAYDKVVADKSSGNTVAVEDLSPLAVRRTNKGDGVVAFANDWAEAIESGAEEPPNRSQALAQLEDSKVFDSDTTEVLGVISEATASEDSNVDPTYVPFFVASSAPLWASEGHDLDRVLAVLRSMRRSSEVSNARVANPRARVVANRVATNPASNDDNGVSEALKGVLLLGGGILIGATGIALARK